MNKIYKGIEFDDYETSPTGDWSRICQFHANQYASVIPQSNLDYEGSGMCGVKDCKRSNHSMDALIYYIDMD